jgi:succinyl-diaminopimelate desuccinylase
MSSINWMQEAEKRKDAFLKDAQSFLQIKSVMNEEEATEEAPLGLEVKEALTYMLELGEKDGFIAKNVDHLAGHLEFGEGKDLLGILCHVDVVPEGDGWTFPPFGAEIHDGKIYARGALDDKGPTMAAYYAMKIVKELGIPLHKRVRMIIGTDEESDWRCVDRYFEKEEMPTIAFAPDADFPIIHAEKGIADFDFVLEKREIIQTRDENIRVLNFQAGQRYNMVPDYAKVVLEVDNRIANFAQQWTDFLEKNEVTGSSYVDNGSLILEAKGVSAHGMEPKNGVNAGLHLAEFLASQPLDRQSKPYFSFISEFLFESSRGEKFGQAVTDKIMGDLTINVGKMNYSEQEGRIGINMRYPIEYDRETGKTKFEEIASENGFFIKPISDSAPHYVDEKSPLIQTLARVYEEQMGEKAELIAIGGGTYARSLEAGVAFGPLFPGREDIAHQKDEYMYIEDLLRATALYAQAIYELANE